MSSYETFDFQQKVCHFLLAMDEHNLKHSNHRKWVGENWRIVQTQRRQPLGTIWCDYVGLVGREFDKCTGNATKTKQIKSATCNVKRATQTFALSTQCMSVEQICFLDAFTTTCKVIIYSKTMPYNDRSCKLKGISQIEGAVMILFGTWIIKNHGAYHKSARASNICLFRVGNIILNRLRFTVWMLIWSTNIPM